jgi:GDP-4-dehydro-6-deoxy-D-mannose reductase
MASVQYFRTFALPVVRVRPFNIIGPGQKPWFACSEWSRRLVRMKLGLEEPVLQVGKLDVERDFTDVRDMVPAFEQVLGHAMPGEVFNLGSGRTVVVGEVLKMLQEIVGIKVKVVQDPAKLRKVEPLRVTGSIAKMKARFGWAPKIPLKQSLADTVQYWHEKEVKESRK